MTRKIVAPKLSDTGRAKILFNEKMNVALKELSTTLSQEVEYFSKYEISEIAFLNICSKLKDLMFLIEKSKYSESELF